MKAHPETSKKINQVKKPQKHVLLLIQPYCHLIKLMDHSNTALWTIPKFEFKDILHLL